MDTSTNTTPNLRLRDLSEEGAERLLEPEAWGVCVRLCLLVLSETVPIRSHLGLTKDDNRHAKWQGKDQRSQPYTKAPKEC